MADKAYRPPELFPEEELDAARKRSGPRWSAIWLPLVPVIALVAAGMIYWLATTTDTNRIFGPSVAEHSTAR
jgi:paraquat-inducible protein B